MQRTTKETQKVKLVISGSQAIKDYAIMAEVMRRTKFKPTIVVSWGTRGIGRLAAQWAYANHVRAEYHQIGYTVSCSEAEFLRSAMLLNTADAFLAVLDDCNHSTSHIVAHVHATGKPYEVWLVLDGTLSLLLAFDNLSNVGYNYVTFKRQD